MPRIAISPLPRLGCWLALAAALLVAVVTRVAMRPVLASAPPVHELQIERTLDHERLPCGLLYEAGVELPASPIEIVVVPTRDRVVAGQPLPLDVFAVNRTGQPLSVLRSLDASDMGWRYPKIDVEIRDAKGQRVEPEPYARCKNMNSLTADDFVEVAPHGNVSLFGEGAFGHRVLREGLPAGTYTVVVHYDLSFSDEERARHRDGLDARIDALPKGVYASAPVTISVH
jgi:hypothetical protein